MPRSVLPGSNRLRARGQMFPPMRVRPRQWLRSAAPARSLPAPGGLVVRRARELAEAGRWNLDGRGRVEPGWQLGGNEGCNGRVGRLDRRMGEKRQSPSLATRARDPVGRRLSAQSGSLPGSGRACGPRSAAHGSVRGPCRTQHAGHVADAATGGGHPAGPGPLPGVERGRAARALPPAPVLGQAGVGALDDACPLLFRERGSRQEQGESTAGATPAFFAGTELEAETAKL